MIRSAAILLAASVLTGIPANSQEIYDLLLKGGHVIDLKNSRNGRLDIAITSGKISKVAPRIPVASARRVVDVSDYYVTPGLIDLNAHFGPEGVDPDHNTLRYGVTTAVDAGSSGVKTFDQFKTRVVDDAAVRILAFLNSGGTGPEAAAELIRKHRQTIIGIRANPEDLSSALKTATSTGIILMADCDPKSQPECIKQLRPGDIQTHVYGRRTPQLNSLDSMWAARKKQILFDVGHGSEGLWFRIAVPAIKQGFLPDTISTGIDRSSIMLARTTMTNVMSKFLAMGLTLEQVIERTTVNPARAIKRADLGSIDDGGAADLAVLEVRKGRFAYLDSGNAKLMSDRELRCVLTVRNGRVVWDTEGLSLTDWRDAGPYSNFK